MHIDKPLFPFGATAKNSALRLKILELAPVPIGDKPPHTAFSRSKGHEVSKDFEKTPDKDRTL